MDFNRLENRDFFEKLDNENLIDVLDIYIESFNNSIWEDNWTRDRAFQRLSAMLNYEESLGLVCYKEGKAMGMILGMFEYYDEYIKFIVNEVAVSKKAQGMGIGTILLEKLEEELIDTEVSEIELITLNNEKTIGFYNKSGFKVEDDLVVMKKEI